MKIIFEEEKNTLIYGLLALFFIVTSFVALAALYYKGFLEFYNFAHNISFDTTITIRLLLKIFGAFFYILSLLLLVGFIIAIKRGEDDNPFSIIILIILQIISILLM